MKVGIIGFGTEGQASYDYWKQQGADLTILDNNPNLEAPAGAKTVLGPDYLQQLDAYDLLVRSPGVKPADVRTTAVVTTATREFFAKCPAPIIGVTGTKGKGTTSTLIAELLKAVGRTVWLGGNIGRAGLDFINDVAPTDIVVLELSSYQLEDLEQSPQIGVCLMIVPEHVQRHGDMAGYVRAKSAIAKYQHAGDTLVYHPHNAYSQQIAALSSGHKIPFLETPGAIVQNGAIVMHGQKLVETNQVGLIGPHNLENICAAVTATWEFMQADVPALRRVLQSFQGLPNRLEFVATVKGVRWINDTFSVNPSATVAAVKSFDEPKVLILGGFDRGLDYAEMASAVAAADVRAVITIGETGRGIAELLRARGVHGLIDGAAAMPEIIAQAAAVAQPGDVVLLSPGCASFDMFKDYKDRGNQFVRAVKQLGEQA